ncbi:MAG: DNA mismatch repair protein MutS [Marinirhabdus sp.]
MKINDTVSVIDEAITGRVISIENDRVTVQTADGFDVTFRTSELVVENPAVQQRSLYFDAASVTLEKGAAAKKPKPSVKKPKAVPPMEVDLHIQKLTNNYKRMSNFEMLDLQMETAKRQLKFAISKKIQRVVFIHGVGEGVLRAELEFLFGRTAGITHKAADGRKYGAGATEIYISQKTLKGATTFDV